MKDTPKEFHKKEVKPLSNGLTIEDVLRIQQENTDIKEKILKEVVEKLFDKKLLNMISRLDNNMAFYVIKHLIINGFYSKYYSKLSYEIEIIAINKPPFYDKKIKYNDAHIKLIVNDAYQNFIDELREITISFKGQGRDELIKLYDALNERIRREEQRQGLLSNFGLLK